MIDKGNQGKVFEITDLMAEQAKHSNKLVAKFSEDKDCLANEIRIIQRLWKTQAKLFENRTKETLIGIPILETYGMVTIPARSANANTSMLTDASSGTIDAVQVCYFIMHKNDQTLEHMISSLLKRQETLSHFDCLEIVI